MKAKNLLFVSVAFCVLLFNSIKADCLGAPEYIRSNVASCVMSHEGSEIVPAPACDVRNYCALVVKYALNSCSYNESCIALHGLSATNERHLICPLLSGNEMNVDLCIPARSFDTSCAMWISNISTGDGILNLNKNSGCSDSSYDDFSSSDTAGYFQQTQVAVSFTSSGAAMAYSVWIDFNDDNIFDSTERVIINDNIGGIFTVTDYFWVPSSAVPGVHKMRIRGDYYSNGAPADPCDTLMYGETEDYAFTVITLPTCSGTPDPGNTLVTSDTVCPTDVFTLTLENNVFAAGITYQWQSSADSALWNDMAGDTAAILATSQATPAYYRCMTICTFDSDTAYSSPVFVSNNLLADCYCISPASYYPCNYMWITNVTTSGGISDFSNTSDCDSSSYADFTGSDTVSNYQFGYTTMSFTSYGYGLAYTVWIDYNNNGIFEGSEQVFSNNNPQGEFTVTDYFNIPGYVDPGTYRMRVRGDYSYYGAPSDPCNDLDYGETEDYSITVLAAEPCTAGINPGNTMATADTVCPIDIFVLTLQNNVAASGITYQWQSSPDSTTWSDLDGENEAILTTSQAASAYYRCMISCTNDSSSSYSNPVLVVSKYLADCYCVPEVSSDPCTYMWITNVTTSGGETNIDNTSDCSSASYTDYSDSQTVSGFPYGTISMSFTSYGYGLAYSVWVDFNDNAYFEDEERVITNDNQAGLFTITDLFAIPGSAPLGAHRMRVRSEYSNYDAPYDPCDQYTYGESEDYSLTVLQALQKDVKLASIIKPDNNVYQLIPSDVSVQIKNNGSDTLTQVPLTYILNSQSPVSYTWNGLLVPQQEVSVNMPQITATDSSNSFTVYTSLAGDMNITNDTLSVNFVALPAPARIHVSPDTVFATIFSCDSAATQTVSLMIENTGYQPLNYLISQEWCEDFENGLDNWIGDANWGVISPGYASGFGLTESPAGTYDNYWDKYIQVKDSFLISNKDSAAIQFMLTRNLESGFDYLRPQLSVNGGGWFSLYDYSGYEDWSLKKHFISSYVDNGDYVRFRFWFHSDGSVLYEGSVIDDVKIKGIGKSLAILSPIADTVAASDSSSVDITFAVGNLNAGSYFQNIAIVSNDPFTPSVSVVLNLTIIGYPQIMVTDSVIDFPPILAGAMAADTFAIYNTGCDTLKITAVTHTDSAFSPVFPAFILPHSSGIIPISFYSMVQGLHTDTIVVLNNSETKYLYVSGNILPAPHLVLSHDTVFATAACDDTAAIPLTIYNTGLASLFYYIDTTGSSGTDTSILVIQEGSEWNVDMQSFIQSNYGVTPVKINSSQIAAADFSLYNIIIVTGNQGSAYYNSVSSNKTKFETFVNNGGIFHCQLANYSGATINLPGGVNVPNGNNEDENTSLLTTHPIVDGLPVILNGNDANAGYFMNLPGDAKIITETRYSYQPTTVEYNIGKGLVIATTMTLGYLYTNGYNSGPMLPNMAEYSMSKVHVYPEWLALTQDSGTIAPQDSTVIDVVFNSTGLDNGIYCYNLTIQTNDPAAPDTLLPLCFTVAGQPQILVTDSVWTFPSIMAGVIASKDFTVYNTGCDSLKITGVTIHDSAFIPGYPAAIPPRDSGIITVNFSSLVQGSHSDTLIVMSNSDEKRLYVDGVILPTPELVLVPDSIGVSTSICYDTIVANLLLINTGNETMDWYAYSDEGASKSLYFNGNNSEVHFGNLGPMPVKGAVEFWMKTNVNSGTKYIFSSSGINNNYKGVNIYQSGTYLYLRMGDDNASYYTFTITTNVDYTKWHHVAVTWDKTVNQVSTCFDGIVTNNGSYNPRWVTNFSDVRLGIGYQSSTTYHYNGEIDELRLWTVNRTAAEISSYYRKGLFIPPAGLTGLWEFNEPSGDTVYSFNSDISGVLYNTTRVSSGALINDPQIDVNPFSGQVADGDSATVEVSFITNGFNNGTHNSLIGIYTNDPLNQFVMVPTQLILNGSPQVVFNDSIRTFPSIMAGALVSDTFKIYNTGCDSLKITGVTVADPAFIPGFPSFILPRDSGIITVQFTSLIQGLHSDTLTILNNSENKHLYVSGTIMQTPELVLIPDSILAATDICEDTVVSTLQIINTGNDTLDWDAYYCNGPGKSLSFNGSTSEVLFGNFGQMPDKGSVEFWMKTNVNSGTKRVFSSSGLNGNWKGLNIYQSGTYLYMIFGNDAGSYYTTYTIISNVGYGYWHHVAVTWDKTQNKIWTYYDGVVTNNGSYNSYWPTMFSDVRLGVCYNTTASYHFNGEIDELRMWSVNRSAAEISNYYREGLFMPPADLTGLWGFNEPSGDTVYSFNSGKKGVLLNTTRVNSAAPVQSPQIEADMVSGLLPGGDTTDIAITFVTHGFNNGIHNSVIGIYTNDPLHPFTVIPTQIILTGQPQIVLHDSTTVLPSIMAGQTATHTFKVYNTGCDSLKITAVNIADTAFTVSYPSFVLPRDSGNIVVSFYSLTQGLHSDTLTILNNSDTRHLYVSGTILPTPELILAPDSLLASTNSCVDTIVATLQVINTGNDTLDWNAYYSTGAGKSLSFNGSTSEVLFGNFGQMPNQGCVEFWMKTNVNSGTRRVYCSSGLNGNWKGLNIYQSGTYLYLIYGDDAGSYYTNYVITTNVGYGYWHHVAVTWDKTQNKIWTYYDGVVTNNGSYNSYWPTVFSDVRLGVCYNSTASYHFNGELDGFRMWNVNRAAADISANAHDGIFMPPAGLTGCWEFNEASGDTVYSFNSDKKGVLLNTTRVNSAAPIQSPQIEADMVSGLLPGGDTATLEVTFYTGGFNNGIHNSVIAVNTNDPLHPIAFVPTQLILNGPPQIVLGDSIGTFHSIMAGSSAADTFMIYNTGCDSLIISALNHNNAAFTPVYPPYVLPRDSGQIIVNFSSLTQAVFYDTITIVSNSETVHLYVWGATTPTPAIDVEPDNIVVSTNNCVDPVVSTLQIINTGNDTLTCSYYFSESLADNFNNGVDNTQWSSVSNGVASNSCGTAAGNNALYFNGSGTREAITKPFNTMGGGVIAFYLKFGTGSSPCENADGGEDVVLEYSINNGATWVNIQTYYNDNYPVFTAVQAQIPVGAQSMTTLIRWRQLSHSGSGYDNWSIDEVSINGTGGVWASLSDTTGSVLPGDTGLLDITFGTGLLQSGTYYQNLVVESNDPLNPIIIVPMSFTINGTPQILLTDSISIFPDIMAGATVTDTFKIYNMGCDSLLIASVNNNDPAFTSVFPPYIMPGDSGIITVSFYSMVYGLHSDTLTILNNSEIRHLYVSGTILNTPGITIIPDSVVAGTYLCDDTITTSMQIINTGNDTLSCVYSLTTVFKDDFENGLSKWITNGNWGIINQGYTSVNGLTESPSGSYGNSWSYYIQMKDSIFVSNKDSARIQYMLKRSMESGYDYLYTQISVNGGSWVSLSPSFTGSESWSLKQFPISNYVNVGDYVKIRFLFTSDGSVVSDGVVIDDLEINGSICDWITLSDSAAWILPGDTSVLDITFNAGQINSGTYLQHMLIATNVPVSSFVTVPLIFTINGSPQIVIKDSVKAFSPIYAGVLVSDTFTIYNTGCDSLIINAVNHADPAFTSLYPSYIMPRDSGLVTVSFYSMVQGLHSDTLIIQNNSEIKRLYVSGTIIAAPMLAVTPDSLLINSGECYDTIISNLMVKNTGSNILNWNAYYTNGAGNALSFNGSNSEVILGDFGTMPQKGTIEFWMKSSVGSGQRVMFSSSGVNNNWKGINIYQYYNYIYLRIGADNGDSYTTYSIADNVDVGNWHHIAVTWDIVQNKVWTYLDGNVVTNGSYNPYWPSIINDARLGIGYSSSCHFYGQLDELRIWKETRSGVQIKNLYKEPYVSTSQYSLGLWEFNETSGDSVYCFDRYKNGYLSNVARVASGAMINKIGIDTDPDNGSVAAGDSANVQVTLITSGLFNGHHYGGIGISSNAPLHSEEIIPLHLILAGSPEIQLLSPDLYIDSIVAGASISDSVQFANHGCDTLIVTNITNNNPVFTVNHTSFTVPPGGSAMLSVTFSPVYAGSYTDTLYITSNGGNPQLFVHAYTVAPPVASVTISAPSFNPCLNTVVTCTAIPTNGGTNPLYQWYVNDSLMQQKYANNNGNIFSYTPVDYDTIICIMTSNLPYVVNNPDTSNILTITILPQVLPGAAGTISGITSTCRGQNNITYTVPVIANITSYIWTLPSGVTGTSSTNSITVSFTNIAVSGNITVKGHNNCGDGAESYLSVTVHPIPVVNAGSDTIINQGAPVTLNGNVTGGSLPYTLLWTPSSYLSDNDILNPVATPNSSITYTLSVTDANSCSATDNVYIGVRYISAGTVVYNNISQTPMQNEWVYLENASHVIIDSVLTSGSGYYYFDGLAWGTYTLYAKPTYLHGGINATDGLVIRRHVVNLAALSGINLNAADVNNSQTVSSADALQVLRRTIGMTSSFAAGDWTSERKSVYLTNNQPNGIIKVLCMGDVNGSYNIYNTKMAEGSPEMACVSGNADIIAGESFVLPIYVNKNIVPGAVTLHIQFPDNLMEINGVTLNGSDVEHNINNGVLSVGAYDENGLALNENVLLSLKCKIKSDAPNDVACFSLADQCEIADKEGNVISGLQLRVEQLNITEKFDGFKLEDNIPNPFSSSTMVRVYVPEEVSLDLSVLNMQGVEIKKISYEKLSAGWHEMEIDGKDFAQGVYFYRLRAAGMKNTFEETRRMMIMR